MESIIAHIKKFRALGNINQHFVKGKATAAEERLKVAETKLAATEDRFKQKEVDLASLQKRNQVMDPICPG